MKNIGKIVAACGLIGLLLGGCGTAYQSSSSRQATSQAPSLASWNDVASRNAIVAFVKRTTTPGSPGFIAPEERLRIAMARQ